MRDQLTSVRLITLRLRRTTIASSAFAMTALMTVAAWAMGSLASAAVPAANSWPPDSLYYADVALETSRGDKTTFAATGERVRIVSMFYASCSVACPLTVDTLRRIDGVLTPAERAGLAILLVTLDPQHDNSSVLSDFARQHRIDDDARWMLGRASLADTRKLGGALDVRYRQLDDGNFNHWTVLVLLDPAGRVLARTDQMGTPDPAFVAEVRKALGGA
jgi:protein SCO1